MKTPLGLIKTYLTFKSYFTWFLMASAIFGIVLFFKRKLSTNQKNKTTTWQGYLTYFLIIIGILSFIYLCFFHKPKEPSSKYTGQLINEIDKAIDKYDEVINNYQGLKDNWEQKLTKVEAELQELYKAQELTQEQKAKIEELINQTETKINEIKTQKQETENNINVLKEQLKQKEEALANKEKEIKLTEKQIAESTDLTEKQKLRTKLDILYDEKIALVKQITEIKSQIGLLEIEIKALNDMLSNAQKLKDSLQRDYNKLTSCEQTLFNQINTIEQRRAEIQNNIDQVNKKIEEIKLEQDLYKVLKEKYKAMHVRMQTYEKENEASAGNIIKWGFKAFDKITDLIPAKYGMKIIGKSITFTRKFSQGMTKATLILHEGHRLWHMYNEVANENKESLPMITKEALEMYTKDIDRDLAKIDADQKDYQKKLEDYNKRIENNNLRNEMQIDKNQLTEFKKQDRSIIDEYTHIIKELETKRKEISNEAKNEQPKILQQEQLEIKLEPIDEEINTIKEELKLQNPNYTRAQKRIKQTNQKKIPELIPIPA
ncbi:DNA double-strand break repair protein Rad50 [Candidatus Phytoplasma fraxini]|uniref:DNA double-strand break repair rad50 ATPase n=1 Tax=Ash yellows phytoplasma TaxID=35780 RepID=A0ABZ2U8H0_ASHYP